MSAARPLRRRAWVLLAVVATLTVALGLWGFTVHPGTASLPGATRFYLTVQLFTLESGAVEDGVPWSLQVARFAAPVVAGYTLVLALLVALTDQVTWWRVRHARDHVVVVGLEDEGRALCRALASHGRRVIGVEQLRGRPHPELKEAGVLVVEADARLPDVLRRLRLERASNLVAVTADDGDTADVMAAAVVVSAARPAGSPLECVGVFSDPALWSLLAARRLRERGDARVRLDVIDAMATGALMLVRRYPPSTVPPGVVVTGTGAVADRVLTALARYGAGRRPGLPAPVVLVGWTEATLTTCRRRHPEVGRLADARCVPDVASAGPLPATVYVCDDAVPDAFAAAQELRASLPPDGRVVVARRRVTPAVRLGEEGRVGGLAPVVAFGLLDEVCRVDVLLRGTRELVAQALHDEYLEGRGVRPGHDDPALVPWTELPESLRASNRAHADDLVEKLRTVGRVVRPLGARAGGPGSSLLPDEVERLARLEHERWFRERSSSGWRRGPRDPDELTTPYLVPWDRLAEDVRERDRFFLRGLPDVLASIGLEMGYAVEGEVRRAQR